MEISIGRLTVTNFMEDNAQYVKFKKDLLNDGYTYHFFPKIQEQEFLHSCENTNQIQIGNYYIIKDQEQLVGWIYLKGNEEYCVLDYGVHPDFRKKGYGTLILKECREYLFNKSSINEIELMIKNTNSGALTCAKKAKYKRLGKIDCFYIYGSCKDGTYEY